PETQSRDLVAGNIDQLKALFPEVVTEGKVDFEVLKQLLGGVLDEREEKYGLNWHGKRRARQLALTPSTGTLRPAPEDSVDWDTTQNLMIEGDNLEVLKLLQKSYAGKVKLIYIDPPYNGGDEVVYPDDFQDNILNYLKLTNQADGNGHRLTSNPESSGRFHTDWLNMMYPRIKVARNLLTPDGLLFVSIDDREVAQLRMILGEVFGEENFEGHIHWRRRHNQPNDPTKMIALVAEHILCYAKDSVVYKASGVGKIALTGSFSNPDNDPRGDWASKPWKVGSDQSGSRYKITTPTGKIYDEEWMGEEATYSALLADNRIIFPDKGNGSPRKKYFKNERAEEGQSATNWWAHDQFGHNQAANSLLEKLFGTKNVFSNPKPIELLNGVISVANVKPSDIVLDFFAGSGTTAHAVLAQNTIDGGNRRYILVQLPEPLDPDNKNQKIALEYCDQLGKPRTIAELTKERLRRAANKVREENPSFAGDLGFRVFKLASSNILAWEPDRENLAQTLEGAVEHLKTDRTEQDILFELLLKLGLDLTVPIEERSIAGHGVHSIGGGTLLVSLTAKIEREDVEPLAQGMVGWHKELGPAGETLMVFRDSAFVDDVAKTNMAAILEQHGLANVRSL
ncbi:MAG: site-specific DNA-methyltransferase, partial [Chloroflexi bacterium]|nr:site-specific DNA-methyltransferase [Chloroflexota bacterium]